MPTTTDPGYVNRNGQMVVRKTDRSGNDHNQYIYEMECTRAECRGRRDGAPFRYGANGSDIHLRLCPACQGGAPGLDL